MDPRPLTRPEGPWFHLFAGRPEDLSNFARQVNAVAGATARVVRGRKATTTAALFDECAAALQFPLGFGHNWDALLDALRDLGWVQAEAMVLCIADAGALLEAAPAEEMGRLATMLQQAVKDHNQPTPPRPVRPLHVVLHAGPGEVTVVRKHWQGVGALAKLA